MLLFVGVRLTEAQAAEPAFGEKQVSAQTIPDTPDLQVNAKGAVVIDAYTGRVLFAQNANGRLPMASTTKIMTALLTLEQEDLDRYFVVDPTAIKVEGSSMGLIEGDKVTLSILAYGMLLASGNDGANAAAVKIAGSQEKFAQKMNQRAQQLGMEDTHFVTPSGLNHENHYSTAYDMALLAQEALKNPRFADICSQSKAVVEYGNPPYRRWLTNHNKLLRNYEGAVGVKTGFTKKAGRCLVSCAMRDGSKLICVTLNCPDDWAVHAKLYDRYFEKLTPVDITSRLPSVKIPVTGGIREAVNGVYSPPAQVSLLDGELEQLEIKARIAPFLYAPVRKGQAIGSFTVYSDGQPIGEVPLTAQEDIPARQKEKWWLARWLDGLFAHERRE